MYKFKNEAGAITFILTEIAEGRIERPLLVAPTRRVLNSYLVMEILKTWNASFTANETGLADFHSAGQTITFPNGAKLSLFSAEDPLRLRGMRSDLAWGHDLAKWEDLSTWDYMMMGNRLGQNPIVVESYGGV